MGAPHAFQHHPVLAAAWVATYLVCVVPEAVLARKLRSAPSAHRSDKGSKFIVILAANLALLAGFAAAITTPALSIDRHWPVLFSCGCLVWFGGMLFRWYAIRTLGRFFTFDVAISQGQVVVEHGPYRWLRHPSYLGALLGEIGFGMTMTNWLALLLPVCCLGAALVYRIRVEEQALIRGLGADYRDYMRRTWRLIPLVF